MFHAQSVSAKFNSKQASIL